MHCKKALSSQACRAPAASDPSRSPDPGRHQRQPRDHLRFVAPTGGDTDLGSPNNSCNPAGPGIGNGGKPSSQYANCVALNKILIVAENMVDTNPANGLIDSPDDADAGNPKLTFDFLALGTVTAHSITVLDMDTNSNAKVYLYNLSNSLIGQISIPVTGDNGKVILSLGNTPNVRKIVVALKGSGAVDDLIFSPAPTTQPVTGACCLPNGTCIDNETSASGYQARLLPGADSLCSQVNCPQPRAPCCLPDGTCDAALDATACANAGGLFQGNNTSCANVTCPQPPGACCATDGTCTDNVTEADCTAGGGTFQGANTSCANTICEPNGACCFVDVVQNITDPDTCCAELKESVCVANGGTYQGDNTTCANTTCDMDLDGVPDCKECDNCLQSPFNINVDQLGGQVDINTGCEVIQTGFTVPPAVGCTPFSTEVSTTFVGRALHRTYETCNGCIEVIREWKAIQVLPDQTQIDPAPGVCFTFDPIEVPGDPMAEPRETNITITFNFANEDPNCPGLAICPGNYILELTERIVEESPCPDPLAAAIGGDCVANGCSDPNEVCNPNTGRCEIVIVTQQPIPLTDEGACCLCDGTCVDGMTLGECAAVNGIFRGEATTCATLLLACVPQPPLPDCNMNNIPDSCELIGNDCNNNGIPDDCEPDCNNNGIPDDCDIDPTDPDGNGTVSKDCNNNGTPDECDIDPTDPDGNGDVDPDCNTNGTPDSCDVDPADPDGNGQVSADCNADGIPDECQVPPDCNNNGIPDACEPDCNNNGIPDDCDVDPTDPDGNGMVSKDCNNNGTPDECDVDPADPDGDGDVDPDCNTNGTPDECDIDPTDPDGDGDVSEDCNMDGIPDECQLTPDCNNNGIPDECEADCNNNGVPDDCDIDPTDPDGDGMVSPDCNENGIPDKCDLDPADPDGDGEVSSDCNRNKIPDECDVDGTDPDGNGTTSGDCDANGTPDECQTDTDGDGIIDECDNCPEVPNADQADVDNDGIGDACDTPGEQPCTDEGGLSILFSLFFHSPVCGGGCPLMIAVTICGFLALKTRRRRR
ncbi:MAG: thrombospondin type 3 repeat-containing protein [Planctomycetes bacterium]|nr:thrombospondin type 3 repeat-containing protein [Planctomycetota bacterium]